MTRPDLYTTFRVPANDPATPKPTLFYRACDAFAELIAVCIEYPGVALSLVFIGQAIVLVAAILLAVFGL
jgi:hypothetical protein